MFASNGLQNAVARMDRRVYAAGVGLAIGLLAGIFALMIVVAGVPLTFAALIGVLVGLYVLTDVSAALYGTVIVMILLPFGTFPVKIAVTPTLLDMALAAFLVVYLFQWMTHRRTGFRLTPVHVLLTIYLMWVLLSFALGLRHAMPTATILRQFAETLLSISMTFVLVDLLREPHLLRRLVLVVTLAVGVQAFVALSLYFLPDTTAENLLVRLSRIGYPNGGVIRYIEDNPELGERAIGTWVDPNALGGLLAISAAMIAPQIFAAQPVLRYRWLTFIIFAMVAFALFLTSSRASFLALSAGLVVIAFVRYRRFVPLLIVAALLLLLLPQTQAYLDRLMQAFQGADLATQMRLGEWRDSLRLISRYPVFGIGFTGSPDRDIYSDVANMYLIMANQIGLVGVAIYLLTMTGVFVYGARAWQYARHNLEMDAIHLGYHAALLTALVNAFADLYFFRLDFQSSITWFWLVVALALASSRLNLEPSSTKSAVVKAPVIG